MMLVVLCAVIVSTHAALEDDWRPVVPPQPPAAPSLRTPSRSTFVEPSERAFDTGMHLKIVNRYPSPPHTNKVSSGLYHAAPPSPQDKCSVYKVSMNQELLYQYVVYDTRVPDLKEFTLCMWTKFHNHSEDHPLFSYSVPHSPKEISAWISNTQQASYFSMAVHGQTFFRLNYPLKLMTWYHSCQSWNGKTGEWQLWVNAERVGRGFHNRLVGHVIKGGGIALSGQEQALIHNQDLAEPVLKQSGMIGEITMLQLYYVALTAGKAHRDHKHHHAHHFKHDGSSSEDSNEAVTEPPPPVPTPIGNGNFLIGGQLQRPSNLNLAGDQQQPQMFPVTLPNGYQYQQDYANGQQGNRIISDQYLNSLQNGQDQISLVSIPQAQAYKPRIGPSLGPNKGTSVVLSGTLFNPANVQFIDDTVSHNIYKRNSVNRDKRDNPEKEVALERSGKKDKRGLVTLSDGSVVDEALLSPILSEEAEDDQVFQKSLLDGLAGVVGNIPVQELQKQTVDEREPAEAEVKAVMKVCSGCAPEPFKKALVLSWRSTPKKLYSGAHYYKGLPICRAF